MNSRTWKRYEQYVSNLFGYERALMKGTKTKEDAAPKEGDPEWVIDAKLRDKPKPWKWMADLVEYAAGKEKPPILVFRLPGRHVSYAIVLYTWFTSTFETHLGLFRMQIWTKGETTKQKFDDEDFPFLRMWKLAQKNAGKSKIAGLIMDPKQGPKNMYACIRASHLISMMKSRHMLEGQYDEE